MKSTIFGGEDMLLAELDPHDRVSAVRVPTLPAYAVEYAEFTPRPHLDHGYQLLSLGTDFSIEDDRLIFQLRFSLMFGGLESCRLVIHHHGIRDYALLFPQIPDLSLRTRLGQLYQEAEIAFESGTWLSFTLMTAGVYEGLLSASLGKMNANFQELIDAAQTRGIVTQKEAAVLHSARAMRNRVHPSRHRENWVTRAQAMDMRTVMDALIRKLSRVYGS